MSKDYPNFQAAKAVGASRHENPYALPETFSEPPQPAVVAFQMGDVLCIIRGVSLPARCVITGEACDDRRKLYSQVLPQSKWGCVVTFLAALFPIWCLSVLYFTTLDWRIAAIALIASVIAGFMLIRWLLRKIQSQIEYSFSRRARMQKLVRGLLIVAMLAMAAGLIYWIFIDKKLDPQLAYLQAIPLIVLLYIGMRHKPLRLARQSSGVLELHGCGKPFLDQFPLGRA